MTAGDIDRMAREEMPLRILHLCWEYPPRGSGIGRYLAEISFGLRGRGHYSVVVTSRGDGLPEEEPLENGYIYRVYNRDEIGSERVAKLVLDLAAKNEVDLIEAPDHLGEAAELMKYPHRPPVMINCRYNDILLSARYSQVHYPWQRFTIWLACLRQYKVMRRERYSIENADLLVAPSNKMMNGLREQGVKLPERTAVLAKPLTSLPDWKNAEAENPTVLFPARLDMGKGIAYLPDLLFALRERFPDVVLEIAGEDTYARGIGSCKTWLEKRLQPVKKHVRFLGYLSNDEMNMAYRRAWVTLVLSKWDTSPTTILESMVRRKAIVSSPYGGMPEYLEGTDNVVCEPGSPEFADAVATFLADRNLREKAGSSGVQRANLEYAPNKCASAYIDFVRESLRAV
ncbi:hypothetical protein GKODMF_10860 [Candidatus Electrothrix gigas]